MTWWVCLRFCSRLVSIFLLGWKLTRTATGSPSEKQQVHDVPFWHTSILTRFYLIHVCVLSCLMFDLWATLYWQAFRMFIQVLDSYIVYIFMYIRDVYSAQIAMILGFWNEMQLRQRFAWHYSFFVCKKWPSYILRFMMHFFKRLSFLFSFIFSWCLLHSWLDIRLCFCVFVVSLSSQ